MGQDWEKLVQRARCWHLYKSALAAITKYHRLGDLHNCILFSHNSKGCKFRSKVLAVLVSAEGSVLGLQTVPSLCLHVAFCLHTSRERGF